MKILKDMTRRRFFGIEKKDANGKKVDYNGGVLPQNISLRDGKLILHGNGNLYTGDIKGINRDRTERADGKRTGAAVRFDHAGGKL